ncbi:Rieske (2Fe-2S) protein [Paracoccus pacificus]|uniref:Rieske (2Fe-2S) protein n=1 Tax=Paracoccus pacificus TaxID=1463598 RepID=A0ABW4R4G4_9RHOB
MSWQDYPRAPARGTALGARDAVTGVHTLVLDGFPILLVKGAAGLRAFVNACPHQFLPLDYKGPNILSADGARLICSSHQAIFDAGTGACLGGPTDECLDEIPLAIRDGQIVIA